MADSSVIVRLRLLGGGSFAREANNAGRGLGSVGVKASQASSKFRGVNSAMGKTLSSMKLLAGAAGAAGAAGGLAKGLTASVNFEQGMANVQARLLTTKGNMEKLSQQAIDLGGKTAFSANQAADAMGEFAAAGFNTAQIMKIMPGTLDLAAASGTGLAESAELSGAIIRQFGLKAGDAGHVADVLTVAVNKSAIGMDDLAYTMKYVGPVAGQFNQSLEDIGAGAAILGNVGIKGETAGTTLRRALVNIVKPSVRTVNLLGDLGITTGEFSKATVDAQGNLRPFPAMLGNLAGHFSKLTKPDQRKALAQLFGVEALPGMLTLMGMGEKKINAMSASLTHSGGAAKKTAGIMRGTVKGAWDQFTGSLETAAINVSRKALPNLRGGLLSAAEGVTEFVHGISGDLLTPKAGIPGFAQDAGRWLNKMGRGAIGVGKQLIEAFKPAMPFFQNVLLPLFKGIGIGVLASIVGAFKVAVPVIKFLATALGWVGTKAAPLKGVIQGVGTVIGFVLGGPILKLLGTIPKIGGVFQKLGAPLRFAIGVVRVVASVVGRVIGMFVRAHLAVLRFGGTMAGAGRRVIVSVGNMVGGVISRIGGMIGKIRGLAGRFMAAGKSIATAIWTGIKAAFAAGAGFAADIGRAIADWLNANTPLGDKIDLGVTSITLPALASGGVIRRGGAALVGERGPELVHLPGRSTVYDAEQTRMARAGATMSSASDIFLTANLHLSGRQIHSEVIRVDRQMAERS